jgi:transposase
VPFINGKDFVQVSVASFPNSKEGIKKFFKAYKTALPNVFVVLETTGGYETLFLNALLDKNIAVHRDNIRPVKSFIRSWGTLGKLVFTLGNGLLQLQDSELSN